MKISAVLERLIRTKKYSIHNCYMCWVVRDDESLTVAEHKEVREHLEAEVRKLHPRYTALVSALIQKPCHKHTDTAEEDFEMCKQWYCWHVFDLKRRGL